MDVVLLVFAVWDRTQRDSSSKLSGQVETQDEKDVEIDEYLMNAR
jgi:hypothetical protein